MTVVNAMKFKDTSGGMVADSQSSSSLRKYNIWDKITTLQDKAGNCVLLGGSGYGDLLPEISSRLQQTLASHDAYAVRAVAGTLSDIMVSLKRERIDRCLRTTFGIDTERALSGQNIGQHLLAHITEACSAQDKWGKDYFSNSFLVLGRDREGIQMYFVDMGSGAAHVIATPYASIGSGADASDHVLARYLSTLERTVRQDIPLLDGMTALLRATNTSTDLNQGVGGVPMVGYFTAEHLVLLSEKASRFASELVRVHDGGFFDQLMMNSSLEAILSPAADVDQLEETVFRAHPQYHKIMRFLRGYK